MPNNRNYAKFAGARYQQYTETAAWRRHHPFNQPI